MSDSESGDGAPVANLNEEELATFNPEVVETSGESDEKAKPEVVLAWYVEANTRGIVGKPVVYIGDDKLKRTAVIESLNDERTIMVDADGIRYELPDAAPAERHVHGAQWYPDPKGFVFDLAPDGAHLGDRVDNLDALGVRIRSENETVEVPLSTADRELNREEYVSVRVQAKREKEHAAKVTRALKKKADALSAREKEIEDLLAKGTQEVEIYVDVYVDSSRRIVTYYDPATRRAVQTHAATDEDIRQAMHKRQQTLPGVDDSEPERPVVVGADGDGDGDSDEDGPIIRGGWIKFVEAPPKDVLLALAANLRDWAIGDVDGERRPLRDAKRRALVLGKELAHRIFDEDTPVRVQLADNIDQTEAIARLVSLGAKVIALEVDADGEVVVDGDGEASTDGDGTDAAKAPTPIRVRVLVTGAKSRKRSAGAVFLGSLGDAVKLPGVDGKPPLKMVKAALKAADEGGQPITVELPRGEDDPVELLERNHLIAAGLHWFGAAAKSSPTWSPSGESARDLPDERGDGRSAGASGEGEAPAVGRLEAFGRPGSRALDHALPARRDR